MDNIDRQILTMLQKNARMPNSDIAKQLNKAPSAIFERIKKLEKNGAILGYQARINPKSVGMNLVAFVSIQIEAGNWMDACGEEFSAIKGVEEVHEVVGTYSYLLKIRVERMEDLVKLIKTKIGAIPEVKGTSTTMVSHSIKSDCPIDIDLYHGGKGENK